MSFVLQHIACTWGGKNLAHGWYEVSTDGGQTWRAKFLAEKDVLEQLENGYAVRKSVGKSRYIMTVSYSGSKEVLPQYYVTYDDAWKAAKEEAMKHIIEINAYAGLKVEVFSHEDRIDLSYGEAKCTYAVEKDEP